MSNEAILNKGTVLTLEASGLSLANGDIEEALDDDRQPADNAGYPLGIFELVTVGTFTVAPTAGAVINLYEQKINAAGNLAPIVDATYKNDYIGTFIVDVADSVQYLSLVAPIHREGGVYWIEWVDGGAGTAGLAATWSLKLTPVTYGTA